MTVAGHDLRLLGAACTAWAALAALLALRASSVVVASVALATAAVALLVTFLWPKLTSTRVVALSLAASCLVCVAAASTLYVQHRGPVSELAAERASGLFVGVVTAQPRAVASSIGFDGAERYVIPMTVEQVDARGRRHEVAIPVIVIGDQRWRTVPWRATVEVRGRLTPSERVGAAQAVLAGARAAPHIVAKPAAVIASFDHLRRGLTESTGRLPADPRGLVPALVVGDVSGVPAQLNADMNVTGMSHLNAVSGSNVTIVLVAAIWCFSWVGLKRRSRTAAAVVTVIAYVLVCHPDPSVVRAGAMGVVGLAGTSWGRPKAACPALGAAIVVLLMWDPWLAVSPGFALSALATLGLVLFARPWAKTVTRRLTLPEAHWLSRAIEMCLIPVAAQALCLPILVCLSGSVSLVSLPANVLAEPLVAPATLAGMVTLLVAPFSPHVAGVTAWLAGLPAWAIASIAHGAAHVPGGSLPWPVGVVGVLLAVGLVVALLWGWRVVPWLGLRGWTAAGGVALLPVAALVPVPGVDAADPAWSFAQCDVGQGDAALVRTGPHSAVAVDVGPVDGNVASCLERHGVTTLDAVILTHFHADHVGGLRGVLDVSPDAPIFTTWITPTEPGTHRRGERDAHDETLRLVRERGRQASTLAPGQQIRLGDVVLDVLWPRRTVASGSPTNNASLVLDVTTPHLHGLLLGDVEREAQSACLAEVQRRVSERRYDIVKVAHHGSANQSAGLYRAAAARYGLIGVGAGNDYGHPKPALLALLAETNTAAFRTDTSGDLDVVTVGSSVTVEPQR